MDFLDRFFGRFQNIGRFQKIVLFAAIIILIITLVVIGIALASYKNKHPWPPNVPVCPDWWISRGTGNDSYCVNMKDLGSCSAETGQRHQQMNFNTPTFTGSNGLCGKYTWAQKCNVSWDGISYGIDNPCSHPSSAAA
jgi:hypothetical protein